MNPCEGHVEVYHDGKPGYVGDSGWTTGTEEVVCRSTNCGSPVTQQSSTDSTLRPVDSPVWLDDLDCKGNEKHLWDCKNPGWNTTKYRKDSVKLITCTNKVEIKLDGFTCAGVVEYSVTGKQTESGYLCGDTFGQDEGNILCKTLGCGEYKERGEYMRGGISDKSNGMMVSCSGLKDVTHLWQCVTQKAPTCNPASVICTAHQRLQLRSNSENVCSGLLEIREKTTWSPVVSLTTSPNEWCKQMYCGDTGSQSPVTANSTEVTCQDSVKVVLKSNGKVSKCYGEVNIELNGESYAVCNSGWTKNNAEVVCRELNCGKLISSHEGSSGQKGIMDNVKCEGDESSLWHCRAHHHDHSKPPSCSSSAYVVCDGSLRADLKDGLGRCAGRVEIQYGGKWQRVQKEGWADKESNTVCRTLGCGDLRKSKSDEKFSQGSGEFLSKTVECDQEAENITKCTLSPSQGRQSQNQETVGITCTEHKVVFLDGERSCTGIVKIEQDKIYPLSGSEQTWNKESADTVCRQMNCGTALRYNSIPTDNKTEVWKESYSCSNNTTSLFDCDKQTPVNYNATIANVTCSGSITVTLTDECWGNVNICMGDKCGGVTKGSWVNKYSQMLCKNLGCGEADENAKPQVKNLGVRFKSLHIPDKITNLTQCNFVECGTNDNSCKDSAAYVVCSDSFKSRIEPGREKCSGNVEVLYGGKLLKVCSDVLNDKNSINAICREQNCGEALSAIEYSGSKPSGQTVISKMECPENAPSSTACKITSEEKTCNFGGLRCSEWRRVELKYGTACSGSVFVHLKGQPGAVCSEGMTKTEGGELCRALDCGNFHSMMNKTNRVDSFWNGSFSCGSLNTSQSIWDCENRASQSHQQLHIKCEGEPNVTFTGDCGGEVKINGIGVCSENWKEGYSDLVCKERGCGIHIKVKTETTNNEQCYNLKCESYHHSLGQCKRWKGRGSTVSVYCTGGVKFNTTQHCGGTLEVKYKKKWEKVCKFNPSASDKDRLCQTLGCNRHNASVSDKNRVTMQLTTQVQCSENYNDISYCIREESCVLAPAEVYCHGYVEEVNPPPASTPVVGIILGIGFLLVVVILIVVLVRVYIVRRAKRSISSSSGMIRRDDEFESGDYEDVTSKADKIDMDFNRGRFRSEAEVMMEGDAHSTTSLPYDDIDEVAETQLLTGQDAAAGASGDDVISDGALDQSEDGVVYEGDDLLENYDDIEAGPAVVETQAEVHDRPQPPPEGAVGAPPGLAQREEDYLVPGQDG